MTDNYSLSGSDGQMASEQVDEISSGKYHAAAVYPNWCYTIEDGYESGKYYIRDVINSSSSNYLDMAYQDWYKHSVDNTDEWIISGTSGNWTIQNEYNSKYLYFNTTGKYFERSTSSTTLYLYKAGTINYYSTPSCCEYEVSVSESGSSHITSMAFSESSVTTCGDAASRTITITVTPASGYSLFGDTKPVFTTTSGTVTATIGSVTDNGDGTFSYECTFNSNDNGAGTFAISPGQFTNYRTVCCTELGDIDGDVNITTDGCDPGEIKVTWKMVATTGIASQTLKVYDENVDEVTAKRITSITASTSNQTKTISGLDPCKDYFVTIENVSSGGSYCAAGAPWTSDVVTTLGYTYTVNATNCQLKSTSDPVPSDMCEGDVLVYYEATGGSTLPDAITVTNAGDEDEGWSWDSSTGELIIDADYVTGDVTVTIFASCPGFSFHYGNDGDAANLWTITCFGDAVSNVRTIEDFEIPSKTHFYVGYQGTFTSGNSSDTDKPNSSTLTWSSLYFDASIGDGVRPMVGQATGATGTVKIIDNSDWTNKKASFIPNGYVLKFGSSEAPFTVHNGHEYRSDLVTYNSTSVAYGVSVGIEDADGDYVATANTSAMRHIFLNTGERISGVRAMRAILRCTTIRRDISTSLV